MSKKMPVLQGRVWALIEPMSWNTTFSVSDLLERDPHLADGFKSSARAVAKAMMGLVHLRRVCVVGRRRGEAYSSYVYVYRRMGRDHWLDASPGRNQASHEVEPEPASPVFREQLADGRVRVRFGLGWKPTRDEVSDRPWRGYQSGLARIA